MKIRVASDLHLEFIKRWCGKKPAFSIAVPEHPYDSESVLILAGDILVAGTGFDSAIEAFPEEWEYITSRFKYVIYINGNHDYYGGTFFKNIENQKKAAEAYGNLYFLEKDRIVLDGQGFIGTTLWSNIPAQFYMNLQRGMHDYCCITHDKFGKGYYITVNDTNEMFSKNNDYLCSNIKTDDVVITHHSPSWKSVHKKYIGDYFNYGYHNDLDNLILMKEPKVWVHGHTHESMNYMIGKTNVICNPRGYQQMAYDRLWSTQENPSYIEELFIDI